MRRIHGQFKQTSDIIANKSRWKHVSKSDKRDLHGETRHAAAEAGWGAGRGGGGGGEEMEERVCV